MKFFAIILVSFLGNQAFAQESMSSARLTDSEPEIENRLMPKKFEASIGTQLGAFEYQESKSYKERGTLQGVSLRGLIPFQSNQTQLVAEVGFASVKNTAYTKNLDGKSMDYGSQSNLQNYRLLYGLNVMMDEALLVTPALGIGTRILNSPKSDYQFSFRREVTNTYLPLQLAIQKAVNQKLSWGMVAEVDLFLSGRSKSYLSEIDPIFNDVEAKQTKGSGIKLALPVAYQVSKQIRGTFKPYYESWEVGDSDSYEIVKGVSGYDPRNTTTVTGADFILTF